MDVSRTGGGALRRGSATTTTIAALLTIMSLLLLSGAASAAADAPAGDGGSLGAAGRLQRRFEPHPLGVPAGFRRGEVMSSSVAALLGGRSSALSVRGGALGRRKNDDSKSAAVVDAGETQPSPPSRWFPILPSELPSFASLSTLMFLFIYVFTTVRDTKDTLVVSHCGAESIPLLKLYGVMPAAAVFIVMYGRASSALGRDALFYATLIPFFAFYALFGFVLYPLRDTIHFPSAAEGGAAGAGVGMAGKAMGLLRYWSYSLYFIVSELWASAGVPLLFWQCANDVTPLHRAKRFYPLFAVFGNMAPILSGRVMSYVVSRYSDDDVGFGMTLKALAAIKVGICAAIVVLYRSVYAAADRRAREEEMARVNAKLNKARRGDWVEVDVSLNKPKPKKKKTTLAESMRELSKSPALRSMATMVLCYNVCIELTEVLWKALLRQSYPSKSSYMSFMATFSQTVGYVALVLQLCASAIIRTLGWKISAMLTPLAMVLLALPFFGAVAVGEERGVPLATALLIGTAQNVVSKVTKYSLFDPCKEMAYIPLGPDAKVRGKAAVDVLGARLGRSVGSASQQLLVFTAGGGNIMNCASALGVMYAATVGLWTRAVSVLAGVFDEGEEEAGGSTKGGERSGKSAEKKKKKKV